MFDKQANFSFSVFHFNWLFYAQCAVHWSMFNISLSYMSCHLQLNYHITNKLMITYMYFST